MSIGLRPLAVLATGCLACTSAQPRTSEGAQDSVQVRATGPGDSLAKLLRRLLTDSDPVTINQAIACENVRLIGSYGPEEAFRIYQQVRETVYTWRDRAALRRVDSALGGHVFTTNCGALSDSVEAREGSAGRHRLSRPSPRP